MIEIWRERVNSLGSPNGDFDRRIQDVLQTSFDSLRNTHKELFLDIACFFVGESKKLVTNLYEKSGIATLINRCLLTVSPDDELMMMHQLLQDMGRKIVFDESKDPAKRSRVWHDYESYRVLRKGNGSDTIEGLALNKKKVAQGMESEPLAFKTSSLAKMDKLKFLQLKYVTLTGSYKNFPKLRLLCWHGCPLGTMPSGLLKNSLVAIDMSHGNMETFEAPMVLNSLKILKLRRCYKLFSILSLNRLPKLETLILSYCRTLTHLCESIENLKMLQTVDLCGCSLLVSLPCIPSMVEELDVDWCDSLQRITFQSGRFSLKRFRYYRCLNLYEVQGLFKLVYVANIDEADLVQPMQWVKEYEDHKLQMITDEIFNRRYNPNQMLYEYGIMSTYLQGIEDKSKMSSEYTSSSSCLFFRVPSHNENNRVQGLHVTCLYRSLGSEVKDVWVLLAKISNTTKGLSWVYNPVVYCEPRVNDHVLWLSYWPIGNKLDYGDEVHVDIIVDERLIVSECGANLVHMEDGKVKEEKNCEKNIQKWEEVIGGDLSEFKVTTGGYYLCRRDLFGLETSCWLKRLFGDNVDYPESQGWKTSFQSWMSSNDYEDFFETLNRIKLVLRKFKTRHADYE